MCTKQFIIEQIETKNPTKEQIINWVRALPKTKTEIISAVPGAYNMKIKPTHYRVGDVFMSPYFHHPYVLLANINNNWICVGLTSQAACPDIIEQCRSRFFHASYFTKVAFSTQIPAGSFMGTFENFKQLKKIRIELQNIFK